MKIALNENTIFQCGLVEFIKASGAAGFSAVEIGYAKIQEALRFVPLKDLLNLINREHISVLSLNAFEDVLLVPESGLKIIEIETKLLAEMCEMIDCPIVVIPSSRWYSQYGPLPERAKISLLYQKRLILIKQILEEYKIEAMFEPISYPEFIVGEVGWINEVLDIPELKELRLVPDIHNLYINGDGPQQLERLKNQIGLFHINDTMDIKKENLHVAFSRTFPGEGVAHAADWIKSAEKAGYTGYYSLELFDENIYRMEPDKAAHLCRKKLDLFEETCR